MFPIKFAEKIRIYILRSLPFFAENRTVFEMSKNVVEPGRQQMTIWKRNASWINKATHAQAHASARAPTPTYACTHPCTARTHARTHAHTEIRHTYTISIVESM